MDIQKEKMLVDCSRAQVALAADGGGPRTRGQRMRQHVRRALNNPFGYIRYFLARMGALGSADATITTFWGERMTVPLSDGDATGPFFFGILAGPEYKLIRYLIRELPSDAVFYDVGANHGFYTLLARQLAPVGEVHAFEPLPNTFSYLSRNAKSGEHVFLNDAAVAERAGEATMFDMTSAGHSGGSTIENAVGERMTQATRSLVKTITIDEYAKNHTPPTIMKLDVEGGEYRVLEGARRTIEKHSPIIAMEVWGGTKGEKFSIGALEKLVELGYSGYLIAEDGTLSGRQSPLDFLGLAQADNIIFKAG